MCMKSLFSNNKNPGRWHLLICGQEYRITLVQHPELAVLSTGSVPKKATLRAV